MTQGSQGASARAGGSAKALLIALAVVGGVVLATLAWNRWRANQYREVSLALMNPANEDVGRIDDLHSLLKHRDELALYYFAREVDLHPETLGKNQFLLGVFYLTRNCDRAKAYLAASIATNGSDPAASRLLDQVTRDGCSNSVPPSDPK